MTSCNHNKAAGLNLQGLAVDGAGAGVPLAGVEIEYPFGSQCCAPSSPNAVAGVCKFLTDENGRWASTSQVCSTDRCSCSYIARKAGYSEVTKIFEFDGTTTTTVDEQVILIP